MTGQRKRYSAELKTKVALEAMKGYKTANEIAAEYGVHPTQIAQWNQNFSVRLAWLIETGSERFDEGFTFLTQVYQPVTDHEFKETCVSIKEGHRSLL